jgi:hypothetical protein
MFILMILTASIVPFMNYSTFTVTLLAFACVESLLTKMSILLRNLAILRSQMSLTRLRILSPFGMSSGALQHAYK